MDPKHGNNTWRNIDGGVVCALARALGNLVFPSPDLSKVPPLEVQGVGAGVTPGEVEPYLVLIDHVAQSSGPLFTHTSDHSITLAITDGSRNLMAQLTSFFSERALVAELERFKANGLPADEVDYRVGVFVGRRAPHGVVRGVVGAIRSAGLEDFLAVRTGLAGFHTVALEGEGRIIFATVEAYVERYLDNYRRPTDGVDPFEGFGE